MKIMDILQAEDIALDLPATNRQAVLATASARLGERAGVDGKTILQALVAREQLGPTTIGHGVALPHARSSALTMPAATLMRLERAIDFDAPDADPVDLVVAVMWPTTAGDEFLGTLSQLCRLLREPRLLHGLREAATPLEARELMCSAAEQTASPARRLQS